jgi:hypothetical protein
MCRGGRMFAPTKVSSHLQKLGASALIFTSFIRPGASGTSRLT